MSRLAAVKEFTFMKALHAHGFPVPTPIDHSRHIVVMHKVQGFPLAQIKAGKMPDADVVFEKCLAILKRLAQSGLIHCDFNEFNLMINQEGTEITLIDFPQMVSVQHKNAAELLERDISGLIKFFAMKMRFVPPDEALFTLEDVLSEEALSESDTAAQIDKEIKASGFDEDNYENVMNLDLFQPLDGKAADEPASEGEEEQEQEGERHAAKGEAGAQDVSDLEDGSDEEGVAEADHGVILEDHTQEKRIADAYSKLRG